MGGSLTAVTGQTGMLARVVEWIAKADYKICSLHPDWDFMWAEGEQTLSEGGSPYTVTSGLHRYDRKSFWIDSGTDDAAPLRCVDYREYQRTVKHLNTDNDYPDYVVIAPDRDLIVYPDTDATNAGKKISFDYWKVATALAADGDYSVIPEPYQEIIIWRAKMYHAAMRHDNGAYEEAQAEFTRMLFELEAEYWPGRENDNVGAAEEPFVIEVE